MAYRDFSRAAFSAEPDHSGICCIIPWIAAAVVGSGIISSIAGGKAADKAADASQRATDATAAVNNRALDLQQSNTAVARGVGDAALTQLASRTGLNLPGGQSSGAPAAPAQPDVDWAGFVRSDPALLAAWEGASEADRAAHGNDIGRFGQWWYDQAKAAEGTPRDLTAFTRSGTPSPQASARPQGDSVDWAKYVTSQPDVLAYWQQVQRDNPNLTIQDFGAAHYADTEKAGSPRDLSAYALAPPPAAMNADGVYTGQRPLPGPSPTYAAPTLTEAPSYAAPEYRETQVAPLDVSLGSYQQSPDYEFQLSEGNRNILANASATGALESGAALKALQKYGQDLAMGDYGQWRDFTAGQYNQDRAFTANRDDAYNSTKLANAQFGYNALADKWKFSNAFNADNALNSFNTANTTYQFRTALDQNTYNSDRDYSTSRYDQQTNNLLNLAGIGQGAVGQYNNAIGNNANALSNAFLSNANVQGNSALAAAGQFNNTLGNATNALAYYYGNQGGGAPGANAAALTYNGAPY